MAAPEFTNCVTIRKNYVAAYQVYTGSRASPLIKRPTSTKTNNVLSKKARQRLACAIELLTAAAQTKRLWWKDEARYVSFKLNFVTLTLPSNQVHTDTEILNNVFQPFIRWWRDKNPNLLYVWKAETQDNGRLHFHVTTNSFIHWRTLRKAWNRHCEKLGYVSRSGLDSPNSTDVHAVKNIKDLCAYLSSYVLKKDVYKANLKRYHRRFSKQLKSLPESEFRLPRKYLSSLKRKVTCKLWDASKLLLEGPCRVHNVSPEMEADIRKFFYNAERATKLDYCWIYDTKGLGSKELPAIQKAFQEHIADIRKRCKESVHLLN